MLQFFWAFASGSVEGGAAFGPGTPRHLSSIARREARGAWRPTRRDPEPRLHAPILDRLNERDHAHG
jgi:hypothetical protein